MDEKKFRPESGSIEQSDQNIPGHKPLEYRDGQFFNNEGRPVHTNFSLGPEVRQKQVFIEYERSFGRGLAFAVTHGITEAPIGINSGKARQEYRELIILAQAAMHNGSEEDCRKVISQLREYRSKYPDLYADVPKEGPSKKFEINNEE